MIEILKTKKYLLLSLCLVTTNLLSQFSIEKITFNSANPFSLNDIISNLKNQDKQEVYGTLIIPDSTHLEKIPLIIGVAGSYGWGEHHFQYLEMFRQMGIATFELNSFKSRNITSTVGSQTEITMAAMILDAYRALEVLSSHPKIDKEKISIVGWSLGGGVTLFSGWLPVKNAINKELNFASHLAFYPPCFIDPENTDFTKSPIHIFIGELDNWTPAKPCEDLASKLKPNTNIDVTVFKSSYHSFDTDSKVHKNENAYNFSDCMFKLTPEGHVLMNYLNIPMSNPFLQKIGFSFCVTRGVFSGGNPEARKKSFPLAKSFMKRTLLE
ncbi:MAG: hypothetical protein CBD44_02615 [Flavobacteriaceae bacterium TMED184]|nr:MAG: hypothetical protein CBD44_02615 [Flavobacteriaceae bacterium TMED184]|tara:strand:+ start:1280 stop:2257 length:978 start_codon:yes stop_codon:yes gene_type:complete